jgi:fido (protein-threonine AMPylation protein)
MKYISPKEAAARWKINERSVRRYCERGLISGAAQVDGLWIIPDDTPKPKNVDSEPPVYQGPAKQVVAQRAKNNHYGIYEYLQVNLAYSSSRMASNRLTRKQVIELYRTGKISVAFEPMKVDDVYEIDNHFRACTYAIDNLIEPLHTAHLRKLHSLLFYGTKADRNGSMRTGEFRAQPHMYGFPPTEISKALNALIKEYEAKKQVELDDILDFYVRFERIRPFEDGNGRLGRLIMLKECLRHQIVPFIIDDKHRGEYHRGITQWDTDPTILADIVHRAQTHFEGKMDICRLFQYQRPSRPE